MSVAGLGGKRGPTPPSVDHIDAVVALAATSVPDTMLVSASRDGVVKVWK